MDDPTFAPGFRLSASDVSVLAVGTGFAVFAPRDVAIVAGMVVGHFFLFCNVFRIARRPELVWASTFALLSASTLIFGAPPWPATMGVSFLLSASLIARETRKPSYHGIAWRTFNPGLPAWWQSQADLRGHS